MDIKRVFNSCGQHSAEKVWTRQIFSDMREERWVDLGAKQSLKLSHIKEN